MRRALMFAVTLALSAAPAWPQTGGQGGQAPAAQSDHSADDQALVKIREDIQTAFNAHDAKGVAAVFTTDGDLRSPDGELVKGRAAIEKFYAALFSGPDKAAKIALAPGLDTRYLGANVAIMNGRAEVTGAIGPDEKESPAYTALTTSDVVKRTGTWQILSSRVWPANAIPGPAPSKKKTS